MMFPESENLRTEPFVKVGFLYDSFGSVLKPV